VVWEFLPFLSHELHPIPVASGILVVAKIARNPMAISSGIARVFTRLG
jgi:hypothetical protein